MKVSNDPMSVIVPLSVVLSFSLIDVSDSETATVGSTLFTSRAMLVAPAPVSSSSTSTLMV